MGELNGTGINRPLFLTLQQECRTLILMDLILLGFFVWRVFNTLLYPNVLGEQDLAQVIASPTTISSLRTQAQQAAKLRREEIVRIRESTGIAFSTRLAEIQAQLALFPDDKRQLAENVCAQFESLNHKHTLSFNDSLTKLELIKAKIDDRFVKSAAFTACQSSLDAARQAIETTQIAITSQAANSYICEITDVAQLKPSLTATKARLRNDLDAVRTSLIETRQTLQSVVACIRDIEAGTDNPEVGA